MPDSLPVKGVPHQKGLLIAFGGIIAILILVMTFMRIHIVINPPNEFSEHLTPLPAPKDPAQTVEAGLFVHNIYVFEADKKTFDVDGWIWLKFSKQLKEQMSHHGFSAANLIHLVNQVDDYDSSLDPSTDAPVLMPDGRYYQRFRFSGHFYVDDLDYRQFPFQTISLPIIIEIRAQRLHRDAAPVQLAIDRESSGIGAYIDISGYLTNGFTLEGATEHLMSRMGNPLADETGAISELRLSIHYKKSLNTTFLKLILPLLTVMMVTLFSPSISASGWEVRVGIPPTSLLTLIFLQQTYQSGIPDFHYLTFLDNIYNLCYLIDLGLFGLFLWGANLYHSSSEADLGHVSAYIDRVDQRFQFGLVLILFLGVFSDWWIHFMWNQ